MMTPLVPDEPSLIATADVRAGTYWAAITFSRGDHTVTIHVARAQGSTPTTPRGGRAPPTDVPRDQRIRGEPASVSVGAGRAVATWDERGATYTLEISCAQSDDPRCARERPVHELASSLVPLGPER